MSSAIATVLLLTGLLIMTLGVFGLLRLPDVATQLHAASKTTPLGVTLIVAGASIGAGGAVVTRSVVIVAVLTVTAPVAAHAIARASARREDGAEAGDRGE